MVTYEVQVSVRDVQAEFERYMRERHIPDIFATGCFVEIFFERSGAGTFRTRYVASSQADIERYLRDHAAHFRADFASRFAETATPEREIWVEAQRWR